MSDRASAVLRVIARLNMGGPALHVAYLSARPARARATTRRSSPARVGHGEQSMAYVAEGLGVPGRDDPAPAPRDLAAPRPARDDPARPDDPRRAADDPAHAHGEGGRGRPRRRAARRPRAGRRSSCTRSTATCCAGTSAGSGPASSACSSGCSPAITDALVAVSPEVRDELVALGVAPASKFAVIRLGIELDEPSARDGGRPAPRPAG